LLIIAEDLLRRRIQDALWPVCQPDVIRSAEEALPRFSTRSYEFIIVDEHLPGASGPELLELYGLRHPTTRRLLISDSVPVADARRVFADRVLTKPLNTDALVAAVIASSEARSG
jgi:DNA-binding response OmpR family regulator